VKAWEVVAVAHNGELVCPACYTELEQAVVDGMEHGEVSCIFASDELKPDEVCSRCGEPLMNNITVIKARLEYLRGEIIAERISYGELAELQDLAKYIDPDDTLLLEWAGVPEFSNSKVPDGAI